DTYAYDAFGILNSSIGTTTNVHRYSGEQLDPNTGFYYLRARYYNHLVGRFVTSDPLDPPNNVSGALNRYSYSLNRPLDRADPSGLWPTDTHHALLIAAFQNQLSFKEIGILINESDAQDSIWDHEGLLGGQSPVFSYEHAMRDGLRNQTVDEARALYHDFLERNIRIAARLESLGTHGHDAALRFLGKNLHAISDEVSPSHRGFQSWPAPFPFSLEPVSVGVSIRRHIARERIINSSPFAEATVAILRHYRDQYRPRVESAAVISRRGISAIWLTGYSEALALYGNSLSLVPFFR
ncbi:MAG: RHS repeat-associated core domain-containing protein, partial [Nitrososphaera sp.]|nr:RHS repeat-associated core domain-containing protein [Nitrososphaera sp.]